MQQRFIKVTKPLSCMNCNVCGAKIGETFLGKIKGTYVKDGKGKMRAVCFGCQKKFPSKEDLIKSIK